jgi:hypothetical protein
VSLLSAAGVRLEDVADVMGHRSTRTTSVVYRHVVVPTIKAAVAPVESLFSASLDDMAYNVAYDLAYTSPRPKEAMETAAALTGTFAVGREGLEPPTPCASCKCATSCANGPWNATLAPRPSRSGERNGPRRARNGHTSAGRARTC